MMTLLAKIKNTIKYAEGFGGELSLEQLWFRLLSDKIYSIDTIKNNFQTISKQQITINKENEKKIKLAKELVKNHLSKFSDILMVGITGSVAAENAKKDEDIDLFIICKANTMWWTRLKLRIYIRLKNIPHRRFGREEKPNDFCFNLWMDESNLVVPRLKRNEKNALDLILIKVLMDKKKIFNKLILENDWAKNYVATGYEQLRIKNYELRIKTKKNKTSIIYVLLNYIAFGGQYLYIRLKGKVRFINLHQAFFHK